jgi:hypothetical protein
MIYNNACKNHQQYRCHNIGPKNLSNTVVIVIRPTKINNVFYNIPAPKEYQQYYHHSISHNNLNSISYYKNACRNH